MATVGSFFGSYVDAATACLRAVSLDEVESVARLLLKSFEADSQILIAGNGGSAALAAHMACDLSKTTLGEAAEARDRRLRAISLSDNVALLTAWANDVRYDAVFAEQTKTLARPGDTLIVISGSGNSPNILAALHAARARGLSRAGLLGSGGGRAKDLLDVCVLVPSFDYGHIEIAHTMVVHLITAWLREHIAR